MKDTLEEELTISMQSALNGDLLMLELENMISLIFFKYHVGGVNIHE